MSLANRLLNNPGLIALTVEDEQKELAVVTPAPYVKLANVERQNIKLQYLMGSRQKGLALWNVLSPQLPNYPPNGGDNGYPTFSVAGLQQAGLL